MLCSICNADMLTRSLLLILRFLSEMLIELKLISYTSNDGSRLYFRMIVVGLLSLNGFARVLPSFRLSLLRA
jgi:hypothetical protein